MKTYLNDGWQYFKSWTDDIFGSITGESVRVPHTNVVTPFNNFDESIYQFVSGYKRNLHLQNTVGKTYLLTFEAVAHYAEVYVNGKLAVSHKCGYTAFTADISGYIKDGDNQVVVKVDSRESLNQPPFGFVIDYLTYGGIYRDVYLQEYNGVYVADAFVKAYPDKPVEVEIAFGNFYAECQLRAEISDGDSVAYSCCYTANAPNITLNLPAKLQLWDLNNPKLYTLKLVSDGEEYKTTFGVRKAEFKQDGFYLNGSKVKIVGLNRHQSYPYVGYAMPESMQRQDAQILKNKLCVNAVRTSHYPQSHYFVDECDRLGLLVFTEIPGWQHIGDDDWKAQTVENVREMVTQYRNHPSVILWGVRINESQDDNELYTKTNAVARSLDTTRQTGGVRYIRNSYLLEDVYTYNDFNRDGASDRRGICPKNAPYLVTEYNGHMFPTKSFDDSPHRLIHTLKYAKMLDDVFGADKTCGCFGWCMFDYNTHKDFGSGDRICYHGVLDMFRNPKWASGVFSAIGNYVPYLEACFTADIGDYPEGVVGDMYILTNADTIKVYKGGQYIRDFTHANSPYKNLPNAPILIDDLIGDRLITEEGFSKRNSDKTKRCLAAVRKYGFNFLPSKYKLAIAQVMVSQKLSMNKVMELYGKYDNNWGGKANELVIEAYKDGKLVAQKTVGSFYGYSLDVTPSSTTLRETNSYDVAEVSIVARDQNGNVCSYVNKAVKLRAEGAIEIIGEDVIALQGGMFGTYVKTVGKKGKGTLYVDDIEVEFEVV